MAELPARINIWFLPAETPPIRQVLALAEEAAGAVEAPCGDFAAVQPRPAVYSGLSTMDGCSGEAYVNAAVEPSRLWGPAEVAEYLGVTVSTLYQWRTRNYGPPGRRVGRHLRYRAADVVAWYESLDPEDR